MKGFFFTLTGIMLIVVLCGFANTFHMGEGGSIVRLFDPDTGCIIGGVFFAMGLLWPDRLIKK
jgi:hypothetical protein